ncbi:MAG: hypothetical protein NWE83_15195 [Candidatus Bathyarchaeota archaeon]|nr:hypothetical protein [Candidatus Bathyarchaeota archaeon]
MNTQSMRQFRVFLPLLVVLVMGAGIGVMVGHTAWSSAATNYSTVTQSSEEIRTVQVNDIAVRFPSVCMGTVEEESTLTIEIANLDDDPRYVVLSLSLVHGSSVDSATISALTADPYQMTIAGYGSTNYTLSFQPSSTGYAVFDINVREKTVGSIVLYIES